MTPEQIAEIEARAKRGVRSAATALKLVVALRESRAQVEALTKALAKVRQIVNGLCHADGCGRYEDCDEREDGEDCDQHTPRDCPDCSCSLKTLLAALAPPSATICCGGHKGSPTQHAISCGQKPSAKGVP